MNMDVEWCGEETLTWGRYLEIVSFFDLFRVIFSMEEMSPSPLKNRLQESNFPKPIYMTKECGHRQILSKNNLTEMP